MLSISALCAQDVVIGDIYYNLDDANKTAEVTYKGDSYYNEYSGSVIIPEAVSYNSEMYSVTSIGSSAFKNCSGLESITIPNSVTTISSSAFDNCHALTSVIWNAENCEDFYIGTISMPSYSTFVTNSPFYNIRSQIKSFIFGDEVEHIPAFLCYGMKNIKEVTIPNDVTSIGSSAFKYCSGITSIVWNAKECSNSPFNDICSNITSFTFGNEVEYIPASLCSGMKNIKELTIPNSVTLIDSSAFSGCTTLSKVNYLGTVDEWAKIDFKYSSSNPTYYAKYLYINDELLTELKITSADSIKNYAFSNCKSIKSVEIGESVNEIGSYAFSGCSGLTSIVWNARNYQDFSDDSDSPFYNIRSQISSFTFGNDVEHIPAYLCYEMNNLKEITIPYSVTYIGYDSFFACSALTKVDYLGTVDKWLEFNFKNFESNPTYYAKDLYINDKLLTDVKITSADSIKDYAFYNCQSIKSVEIGESVTKIGDCPFYGCSGITTIFWSSKNYQDFSKYSESPFYDIRSNIISFTFSEEVEHIPAYLCYEMNNLKEITIPNTVTSIGYDAFSGCSGLTSVTIGENVTSIHDDAFDDCYNITSVIWNAKNCNDFDYDFYNETLFYSCSSGLTSFSFGEKVEHVPANLCRNMSELKEITIPSSVLSIGDEAFFGCSGLSNVTISNSVTSIGSDAFYHCSGLTSLTIGNSVSSIGHEAFSNCNNLEKVTYNSTVENWVNIDFASATSNPIYFAESLYIDGEQVSEIKIANTDSIKPYAFIYCKGLKYVEVGNSVKYIGTSAFEYCTNLKTVYNKSDLNIIKGTTQGYIAYYADVVGKEENGFIYDANYKLIDYIGDTTFTTLDIPNVIEEITPGIFNRFPNLTSIRMGDNIQQIPSDAFDGCNNLKEINISNDNSYFSSEDGVLYNKNKTTLIKFPKAKEGSSFTLLNTITYIEENAFEDCNHLTSIIWNAQKCNDFESVEKNPLYGIKDNITSFVFGEEVEHIPAFLCYEMNNLKEVSISKSVASIGKDAFYNCSGITSVKWDAINCENFTVSTAPFNSICSNITSFVFGNEVEHIPAYICYNMGNIADIAITNNIKTIGTDAFFGCSGLTSILWNAKKSEDFLESTAPFNNICTKITSLTFGEEVEHIPSYICNGMAKVSPKVIPNSVKTIGKYAFWGTRVYKTNWEEGVLYIDSCLIKAENEELKDTYSIKEGTRLIADEAFLDCNVLTSLSLASTISYVGNDAFSGCTNLTEIVIPNNIVYMGWNVFSECYRLSSIIWNVKKCDDFENYETSPFYDIRERITSFKFGNEVEYIPAFLCYDMSNIPQISLPSSVKVIGKYAFAYCDDLTSLVISDGVITINDCAFSGCRYVNELLIGKSVEHIGTNVFQNCYNIDNIVWNAKNCSDFESAMQSAFYSIRSNISSFKIGNGVEYIPAYLCYGMDDLYSIIVPENVTAIGQEAFSNCNYLNSVIWKAKNCKDFSSQTVSPFYNQTNRHVSYFTFGNMVEHIPSYLCYGMGNLTEVLVPHRVVSLGDSVFFNCENLTKVTSYPRNVPTTGEDVFAHYNAYLYVQCVSLDEYVDDDVFGMFKRIKCIEVDEVEIEAEEDSEKIEIEIDEENNNATITWPSTNNAKSYELVISRKGEVFCTLIFNSNGQLLSIDFSTRSASIGFQFTVTGLEEASKYDYKLLALDENNNELQSYYGEFETSGYVEEEDEDTEETAIIENLADANITISEGVISCPDSDFTIYNTIGQNVTSQNGSLTPGVYVVQVDNDFVKVMMK